MNPDPTAGAPEKEPTKQPHCRFCCEPIQPAAVICKECGEPQVLWWRASRFFAAVLSSVVALGSLGIAVLQYDDAKTAQTEATAAKASESTTSKAYDDAFRRISRRLETNTVPWQQTKSRWLNEVKSRSNGVAGRAQSVTDWTAQSDSLVRRFLDPEEKP